MLKKVIALISVAAMAAACTTIDPQTGERVPNRAATGAIVGALGGAAVGTAAGGDDRRNAVIGAGIGAIAGAAVGGYMDQQQKKLQEQLKNSGVGVTRTGEGEILLNLPSEVTFAFDSAQVQPQFRSTLSQIAQTLTEYPATTVDVTGHADSVGDEAYNQRLSQRRADAVAQALTANGVQPVRVVSVGYGEGRPVATNETPEGRARNRRVEIKLNAVSS